MNTPSQLEMAVMKHKQDSIALVEKQKAAISSAKASTLPIPTAQNASTNDSAINDSSALAQQADQLGSFAAAGTGKDEDVIIENDLLKITLTSKGGRVKSAELKKYKTKYLSLVETQLSYYKLIPVPIELLALKPNKKSKKILADFE